MDDKYQAALQQAQEELARIQERAGSLIKLIETLKSLSHDDLYELNPPPGYVPEGLTPEIKKVLSLTTVHLSPVQIRDSLVLRGFPHSNTKNLLISVHTALGRMEEELDIVERDGKRVYKTRNFFAKVIADLIDNPREARASLDPSYFQTLTELVTAKAELAPESRSHLGDPPAPSNDTAKAALYEHAKKAASGTEKK